MQSRSSEELEQLLLELKKKLIDLEARWPAHSIKPSLVEEREMIEEETYLIQKELEKRKR